MATVETIEAFKRKWIGSEAAERSNSQLFLTELTDLMGVPHPTPAVNDASADHYVFERRVRLAHPAAGPAPLAPPERGTSCSPPPQGHRCEVARELADPSPESRSRVGRSLALAVALIRVCYARPSIAHSS